MQIKEKTYVIFTCFIDKNSWINLKHTVLKSPLPHESFGVAQSKSIKNIKTLPHEIKFDEVNPLVIDSAELYSVPVKIGSNTKLQR